MKGCSFSAASPVQRFVDARLFTDTEAEACQNSRAGDPDRKLTTFLCPSHQRTSSVPPTLTPPSHPTTTHRPMMTTMVPSSYPTTSAQ